jgi:hypothetical protein
VALFQTEVAIDTNILVAGTHSTAEETRMIAADTNMMVRHLYQNSTSSQNHSVGATCYL